MTRQKVRRLFHVLRQEFLRPLPGKLRGLLAVARALVAIEAVRRVRIGVGFRLRQLLLDLGNRAHRDAFVLLAEVHLQRASRLLVGELGDHAAVEANCGGEAGNTAGGKERRGAAHAEADDADRADALEVVLGRGHVRYHVVPVEIAEIAARVRNLIRRIARLEIAHETVEYRRRHRGVAERGEAVAHRADVMIDAENFLHHYHATLRLALRVGAIGAERVLVGSREGELLAQVNLPFFVNRYGKSVVPRRL